MDLTNVVAANVKAIREQKKLTLDGAAEITGVSRSMLAQIEKGEVNPTISILWKIANGYKVSFTSFIENRQENVYLQKGIDIEPLIEDKGRYLNYPIFAFNEQKLFESYRILIKENGSLKAEPHLKGAEEYITVFSGKLEVVVDSVIYNLEKGDSIRFYADVSHSYRNVGKCDVELSMIIYYN